jgi:sulfur carrier protein
MIAVRVNGRRVELAEPTALLDYLDGLGVDPRAVAIEINGDILPRERYGERTLRDGDEVEIVRMVGGGRATADRSGRATSRARLARRSPRAEPSACGSRSRSG